MKNSNQPTNNKKVAKTGADALFNFVFFSRFGR
jgi:hypothetical protein